MKATRVCSIGAVVAATLALTATSCTPSVRTKASKSPTTSTTAKVTTTAAATKPTTTVTTTTAAPTTTTTTTAKTTTTLAATSAATSLGGTVPAGAKTVSVSGTKLIDSSGATVQLRGVNRSGFEYSCTQSQRFITDPYTSTTNNGTMLAYADTVASSLLTWDKSGAAGHAINTVRIPLNESCWLGINGAPAAYSGTNYQAFLKRLVDNLTRNGMYVVLTLHWSAPGTWLPGLDNGKAANGQNVAPNVDHSVTFWTQVATAYKNYPNVLFDLFNEPGLNCNPGSGCPSNILSGTYAQKDDWAWTLYRDGGSYTYTSSDGPMYSSRIGQTFQVAGTQQLVNAIRATGSRNPVIVETLGWGNGYIDMMGTHLPKDTLSQVIASIHFYDFSGQHPGTTSAQSALDAVLKTGLDVNMNPVANVSSRVPFFVGEFGSSLSCPGTNATFVQNSLNWMDARGYSYTAWGWDQGQGCGGPTLVTNNDTGATTEYGQVVKQHLQNRQG